MELYAKKITKVPSNSENSATAGGGTGGEEEPEPPPPGADAKSFRDIVHSHEVGAHAKENTATNWLDPDTGLRRVKLERKLSHICDRNI